ncbi:MAG: multidrug effflux MFS transporter [Spirochaetes bacterium]|nr:multidrug effflux MFS transporter [Spirochaetota bacterium]
MDKKLKAKIIIILGALTGLGPLSIDMYLPGFQHIANDLKVNIAVVSMSLTSYFIGISSGQLIYGPLMDRYGRKKPLMIGLFIYLFASLGCALSPNIYCLIVCRFVLALGACSGIVGSRAIVKDMFLPEETVNVFSMLMLVMGVSPIIAPLVGSVVAVTLGWRFVFYLLFVVSFIMILTVFFLLPESRGEDKRVSLKPHKIFGQYISLLNQPMFVIYAIAGSVIYSGLFAYISGASFVYMKLFKFSEIQFGFLFAFNAVGIIGGSQINRFLIWKFKSQSVFFNLGIVQVILSLILISSAIFINVPVSLTVFLIFLYLFIFGILNPIGIALALYPFKENAGTASALLGGIQMVASAVTSVLVSRLHNETIFPMIMVMSACASISVIIQTAGKAFYKNRTVLEIN